MTAVTSFFGCTAFPLERHFYPFHPDTREKSNPKSRIVPAAPVRLCPHNSRKMSPAENDIPTQDQ